LSPSLQELHAVFERLRTAAGAGSERARVDLLAALNERLNADERDFLSGLLLGELRQGALRALVVDALAAAFAVDPEALRRAVMFAGELEAVAAAVAAHGVAGLAAFTPTVLRPIGPMLAATANDIASGFAQLDPVAVEWKLDGVRVQVHRDGASVRAFSRQLRDITHLVPGIEALVCSFAESTLILDGELVGHDAQGRPLPFQDLMSRFSTAAAPSHDLHVWFFDVLFAAGESLVDRPYRDRRTVLERIVPAAHCIASARPPDAEAARALYREALARGHEGVLLKALDSPYAAGRRGSQWLKVKPAVTLDLVILAAEWGHGRRRGVLSNIHLGARRAESPGEFAMLGKTFKGLTDDMLQAMTADLLQLAVHRDEHVVHVRPERVVEIAFDSVQRSPRYDSGLALRFARVKRFRFDRTAADAATLDEVRAIHAHRQHPGTGRHDSPAGDAQA
jgi:DNA ligase-1